MKSIALVLVLTFAAASLGAEEAFSLGFDGPRIFGADGHLASGSWTLGFGAGFQEFDLPRNPTDGTPREPPSEGSHDTYLAAWLPDATVELKHTWDLGEALVWAAAGVHGWGDFGAGPAAAGLFPDWAGNLSGYGQLGLSRIRMVRDARGVLTGTSVQLLAETGPGALSIRPVWYNRATVKTALLVPLWETPSPEPLFAGTLGFRANALWVDGDVPVSLLDPTQVRGYHQYFDTKFRTVASSELRLSLPSLWGDHDLVPMVLLFGDLGWGSGYAKAPAAWTDRSVWLAGAGAGVGMTFFDAVTPTVQFGLPLLGGEADFWWTVAFTLKF